MVIFKKENDMKLILRELRNNIDVAWTLSRAKKLEEGQSFTFGTLIGKN